MTRRLLLIALLSSGCAARLVTVGQTYLVQWPGQEPEVVEIHGDKGDGWVQCRNVTEEVVWTCNLNAALFFVKARMAPPPPERGQQTD